MITMIHLCISFFFFFFHFYFFIIFIFCFSFFFFLFFFFIFILVLLLLSSPALFSVVGAIPATRVTTHTLPVRVAVYVSTNESKNLFKGARLSKAAPQPDQVRKREELKGKREVDTSHLKVKFWNHETEVVVDGLWKGRCRENEIYGVSKKRSDTSNATFTHTPPIGKN